MDFIIYLFLGVFLGIVIERYLFAVLDLKMEVFQYKESEKAIAYKLNAEKMAVLFNREYSEVEDDQELTPAIGFSYSPLEDNMYYEGENKLKRKVGC